MGLWGSKDLFPALGVLVSPVWGTVLDYGDAGSNVLEEDQEAAVLLFRNSLDTSLGS